jgi:Kef-type K+ transport system membrane component KefB
MPFVFDRLYRRLGRVYFVAYGVFNVVSALIICLGTVGLFKLYEDPGSEEFWITLAFAEAVCLLTVVWVIIRGWFVVRPLTRWVTGQRDEASSLEAWRASAGSRSPSSRSLSPSSPRSIRTCPPTAA